MSLLYPDAMKVSAMEAPLTSYLLEDRGWANGKKLFVGTALKSLQHCVSMLRNAGLSLKVDIDVSYYVGLKVLNVFLKDVFLFIRHRRVCNVCVMMRLW